MKPFSIFRAALEKEHDALSAFIERVDSTVIEEAVELLRHCKGRVAIIGMGKCGHVGKKLAATFVSTGTPATFVHPAEALHGDLGFIQPKDVALVLSNSGETKEIVDILPYIKRDTAAIVGMTGGLDSSLARQSDTVVNTQVTCEADSLNLAPTSSTTLMLAAGDALAVTLMQLNQFAEADYAKFHPGGSLGSKLLFEVDSLMHRDDELPLVEDDLPLHEAIIVMTAKRLGAAFVVDKYEKLCGIITDGDIRRAFQRGPDALEMPTNAIMSAHPRRITKDMSAIDALRLMEDDLISILVVVDDDGRPVGALHIHDLVRAGIA